VSREENFYLAQMLKKDQQIELLTESVSCMAKEIQKLNEMIKQMQVSSQGTSSKGSQKILKVSHPEVKKNDLNVEKTPLSKVPRDVAKKTVKFVDVAKRNLVKEHSEKIEETVLEIQASSWKGNHLSYLILFESGMEKWIKSSECSSIQGMVNEFHKVNPGAPNSSDYSLMDSIKMERRKKKNIIGKIKKNQAKKLDMEDIGFIANSLVKEVNKPKEFSKVAFNITNKRVLKGFSYNQKQETLKKIIHQYGLNQKIVRLSLVGDSILELYTIKEEEEIVISRMKSNGWNLIDFKPEELPEFSSKKNESDQKTALINRIGFLYAGTTLINLRKILVEDLSESTKDQIIKRAEEILEKRTAIKEGRAQAKFVQKSEL
jgi:hypothetical protein